MVFAYRFIMNKMWWIGAFIVVGILAGTGVLWLVTRPPRDEPVRLLPAPTPAPIMVYVSGSVMKPGIYTLPYGSRVNDAIQAAGGLNADANSQAINLAEILVDGVQVNVPANQPLSIVGDSTRSITVSSQLININTASLEELDTLPEIGPITAQKIIDYREANGAFKTVEDLLEVEGIGEATFNKVRDLITVGTSP
jgi:competence protein ComEA